jgi:hypothetical protein
VDEKQHLAMNHAKQKLDKKRDKKGEGLFLPVVTVSALLGDPCDEQCGIQN